MQHKVFVLLAALMVIGGFAWGSGTGTDATSSTGTGGSGGMYSQSPFLDARVASGELPPVDERLPSNPLVVTPVEEIGTYGGRLTIFTNEHPNPWARLVGENPEGAPYPIGTAVDGSYYPRLAEGWSVSDDLMSITLNLREGAKFSNGDPFTAEDYVFSHEEMRLKELGYIWGAPRGLTKIVAVDDFTVRFEFDERNPKMTTSLAGCCFGSDWGGYQPTTWLKQWHAEYNDDAQTKAQAEGYDTWQEAFTEHSRFCCPQVDMERPTMFPFMLTEVTQLFRAKERNPYYIAVDPNGQQLPYIDTALIQGVERETIVLKIIAGEADFAERPLADYPVMLDAQESGNFNIILVKSGWEGTSAGWMFQLNHADPVKREIFNNLEFRRAMSLALDRDRMNDVAYLGQGVPSNSTLYRGSSIYKPEWGEDHPYVRHDPAEASRMLDAIGLDRKNGDGIRLMRDGNPLVIVFPMSAAKPTDINELLKEDFEAVGVGMELRTGIAGAVEQGFHDGTVDFTGANSVYNEAGDYGSSTGGINQWVDFMMYEWSIWWHERNSGFGPTEKDIRPGVEPPDEVKEYLRIQIIESKSHPFGSAEQKRLSTLAWDLVAENLWQLGAVQAAPLVVTHRANLMNVPSNIGGAGDINSAYAPFTDQMFFKN